MSSIVHFGECTLFLGERRLECRGQQVKIGSRALDLLAALALRKGEVVPARELMKHAWPTSVVTDSSLRVHIGELRKALSASSPNGGSFILNIPGRGYQLAGASVAISGSELARTSAPPSIIRNLHREVRVFGRASVVQQVLDLLATHSIVTLVAPGGMGKTTVANLVLQVNKEAGSDTLWVDLSNIDADGMVAREVARAAGFAQPTDSTEALIKLLRSRSSLLLVLDCCERAVVGAALLSEALVRQVPGLRILATSREPLHTKFERVVRLQPLEIEPAKSIDPTARGPAVELFIERASDDDLTLDLPRDLPLIEKICHGLDGMPLAIELAAAHLVGFGLQDLASLIGSGFQLGSLGKRTASERHKTLEATFEWSYRLLDEPERQILEWLAVFESGASLQAILEVLGSTRQDPTQLLHGLALLVDKSLVKLVPHEAGSYYRLLDTTRAFAAKRLQARGEVMEARRSHAQYMIGAAASSRIEGQGVRAAEWFSPRGPNLADLRAALTWARSEPSARSLAIALSVASAPTFLQLSLLEECELNCERALALLPGDDVAHHEQATRLLAFHGGSMLGRRGPIDECLKVLNAAHTQAEEANDSPSRALVLSGLFWLWIYRGEPMPANSAANSLLEARGGDVASTLLRDGMLAYASTFKGDQHDAKSRLLDVQQRNLWQAHGQFMRIGSEPNVFYGVFTVKTHWLRGEIVQARALYQRLLPSLQKAEHGLYYCWALNEVVIPMHSFWGDLQAARAASRELDEAATRQTMAVREQSAACASMAIDLLLGEGDVSALLEGIDVLRKWHFACLIPWLDSVAAQGALSRGQGSLAKQLMDRAIEHSERTGSRWWLPELHRVRGRCLLANASATDRQQGLSEFRLACDMARNQGAAALELSAAVEWGRSLPEGIDQEVRACLEGALSRAPEMASLQLAEHARRLLKDE